MRVTKRGWKETKEIMQSLRELLIGSSIDLTGPIKEIGINIAAAVQMAVDEVNQAGGIKAGGNSYLLRHIMMDDGYQNDRAVANAVSLIYGEKSRFMLTIGAGAGEAVCRVSEPEKVIHFGIASSDTFLKGKKYTFRLYSVDIENTIAIFRYLKQRHPQKKTIYITSSDDPSGHHHATTARKAAEYHGYRVLEHRHWHTAATEDQLAPLAQDIADRKPNILHSSTPLPGAALCRMAWERGLRGLVITNTGGALDWLRELGAAGEGALNPAFDFESELLPRSIREFAVRYKERFGAEPMQWSTYTYATVYAIAEACKKANTITDADRIKKVFETETLDTPWGEVRWAGKEVWGVNHHAFLPKPIGEFSNGRVKIAALYTVDDVLGDFMKMYGS